MNIEHMFSRNGLFDVTGSPVHIHMHVNNLFKSTQNLPVLVFIHVVLYTEEKSSVLRMTFDKSLNALPPILCNNLAKEKCAVEEMCYTSECRSNLTGYWHSSINKLPFMYTYPLCTNWERLNKTTLNHLIRNEPNSNTTKAQWANFRCSII